MTSSLRRSITPTHAAGMTKGAILNAGEFENTLSLFDNELQHVTTIVSKKK
jgi:hypothetical protein